MRPLTLTMTAFGPYADTVHLDFADLKEESLFLITGPTGAGKTSILDAMVYALFGESSGGLRSGTSMRSDYASPETLTKVTFTFSVGDSQYKIERCPKQKVKKRRGEGFREQAAVASLAVLEDGEWQEFSSRANDIKEKVHEILGFRAEQFLQVVLLPQGEFRKLLVAPTSERETLMHSLFRTEIYARLQDMLKEEHDKVYASAREVVDRQRYLLSTEGVKTETDLREKLSSAEAEQTKAAGILAEAQANQVKILADYELGEKRQTLGATINEKQAELADLMKQAESVNGSRQIIERLEQVTPIFQKETERAKLEAKKQQLTDDLIAARTDKEALLKTGETLTATKASLAERKPMSETYRLDIHKAGEIKAHFDAITLLQTELKQLGEDVENAEKAVKAANELLKTKLEEADTTGKSVEELRKALGNQSQLMKEREAVLTAVQLGEKATQLIEERAAAKVQAANTRHAYEEAKQQEELAFMERAHQENLCRQFAAAGLAVALKTHEACPVCGSTDHPHKAVLPDEYSEEAMMNAEKAYSKALQETSARAERQSAAAEQWTRADEAVKESERAIAAWLAEHSDIDIKSTVACEFLAEADSVKTILNQRSQALAVKEKKVTQLNDTLAVLNNTIETIRIELKEKETSYQDTRTKLVGKQEGLALHQEAVKAIDKVSWAKELQAKETWLATFEKEQLQFEEAERDYLQAKSSNETTIINLEKQQRETMHEVTVKDQEIEAELRRSKLSDADLLELRPMVARKTEFVTTVKNYDAAVDRVQTLLTAASNDLASLAEPSMVVTKEMKDEASVIYENAVRNETKAAETVRHLEEVLAEYSKLVADNAAITERFTFINNLYELANGGNAGQKGVTFERYVLGAILEEVVVAANVRLRQMSRGRYELRRAQADSVSRGHRGLDLSVLDTYTGYERPANTLSGGETFLASLSLAMGLADIIQAYAGGIHLDTIFIDEGFGTLDPDTLDIAMETLVELQKSGRLVGIISHVPELKGRIPAHLVVEATNKGSTAHFLVP